MGIQGLAKLIADHAPKAIKEEQIKNYFGRKIAIDASMSLYQFLIAVRPDDLNQYTLTNEAGEQTSHLQGVFYRTVRMLDNGLKPVFVFDGRPPTLKSGELARRRKKRVSAKEELSEAKEEGDKEAIAKLNKRTVAVTPKHSDEAKKLLRLMGVPVIEAPTEAEAQCTAMVKAGLCYAVASEDMDTLTLGAPILLRHLTYSEQRKAPILEFHLDKVLEGLGLSMDSFIDLCILLGCDYCDTIRGIGPKRAFQLIKQYGNIETVLKNIDKNKYQIPENFPFEDIRELFKNPEVLPPDKIEVFQISTNSSFQMNSDNNSLSSLPQLKWSEPNEEGLIQFLCREKGFSEDRVRAGISKLQKAAHASVQNRITSFFTISTQSSDSSKQKMSSSNTSKVQSLPETKPTASISTTQTETTPVTTVTTTTTTTSISTTKLPQTSVISASHTKKEKQKRSVAKHETEETQELAEADESKETKVFKPEKRKKSRIITDEDLSNEMTAQPPQTNKEHDSSVGQKDKDNDNIPEKNAEISVERHKKTNADITPVLSQKTETTHLPTKIHPFFVAFQKQPKKVPIVI
jgi:flap endonuclease-1